MRTVVCAVVLALTACLDLELPGGSARPPAAGFDGGTGEATVIIRNLAFEPQELHVRVGTTVVWKMEDTGTFHFVSEGDPRGGASRFESPQLEVGDSWSRTFEEPGTYVYFCKNHSSVMRGAQVVVEP